MGSESGLSPVSLRSVIVLVMSVERALSLLREEKPDEAEQPTESIQQVRVE